MSFLKMTLSLLYYISLNSNLPKTIQLTLFVIIRFTKLYSIKSPTTLTRPVVENSPPGDPLKSSPFSSRFGFINNDIVVFRYQQSVEREIATLKSPECS